jgi:hypothetical protein
MGVKIIIKSTLSEKQSDLVEKLALAIEQQDSFKVSILLTRLEVTGVKVQPGVENNETSSISTEQ